MFVWRSFDALNVRELHDVLKLRADVFVVEQACVFPEIDGRDPQALHLLARTATGGPLAGTLRLFPPDAATGRALIGRVATASAVRGTGLGRALMAEGVAEARLPLRTGADRHRGAGAAGAVLRGLRVRADGRGLYRGRHRALRHGGALTAHRRVRSPPGTPRTPSRRTRRP